MAAGFPNAFSAPLRTPVGCLRQLAWAVDTPLHESLPNAIQFYHVGERLNCFKMATVGVLALWKWANTTNRGGFCVCFLESWLVVYYLPHATGYNHIVFFL